MTRDEGAGRTPDPSPPTGARATTGRWATVARWAFYAAIAAAFAWFVWTVDWDALDGVELGWGWIAAATAVALAFRYLGVVVWRVVLVRLGAHRLPRFRVLADVYARAWLARYIPGTLPWIAGKILLAAEQGISKSRLAVSTLVEAAAQVVAVGAVSLTLLATDPRIGEISPALRIVVAVGAVAAFVAMAPPVFNRILALGFRLLRRGTAVPVGWPVVRDAVLLYGGGALLSGLAYALLMRAVVPEADGRDLLFAVGAFGFAGVVGILTPLVPSGLGTRDATQLVLLLVILPAPTAALVVLLSRVWSAAVDVLFWAVAALAARIGRASATLPPRP
ncbi:lysylphosphatidylglycerol synthase domain-containing protein [Demequina sp. NBRC 110056]|uniref:lysylphosphatidylglycerol synthase domain-containing protein n=1 Tax=Demequina sp. NBRC 110056 TaxID=1570345 RepID=UPI0009FF139E|nr:lysylphosphatidylglycerol synthase domain-containing protein [Demequina sp. NBRC 110056]